MKIRIPNLNGNEKYIEDNHKPADYCRAGSFAAADMGCYFHV